MATTKASRKAKRESYGRGNDSDNGSTIIKARKSHDSKEAITKGAVKKSDARARQTREYVMKKKDKPMAQNGRQPGRQLIRWNGKSNSFCIFQSPHKTLFLHVTFEPRKVQFWKARYWVAEKFPHETCLPVGLVPLLVSLRPRPDISAAFFDFSHCIQ
jgi:hypothetical protein